MERKLEESEGNLVEVFSGLSPKMQARIIEFVGVLKQESTRDPQAAIEAISGMRALCAEALKGEPSPSNTRLAYDTGMSDAQKAIKLERYFSGLEAKLTKEVRKTGAPNATFN